MGNENHCVDISWTLNSLVRYLLYFCPVYVFSVALLIPLSLSAEEASIEPTFSPASHEVSSMTSARSRHLPDNPDWAGIISDTAYFLGWQVVAVGVIYASPEKFSSWDSETKSSIRLEKFKFNISNPVIDQDKLEINYIMHPYWGATYYTRARERGLSRTDSFLISALWSTLFEYGGEAFFEPVSVQDMFVTPIAGALIGEYWFAPLREHIRDNSDGEDGWDKTLMVITDPFYYLNSWLDRLLGVKSEIGFELGKKARREPNSEENRVSQPRNGENILTLNLRAVW